MVTGDRHFDAALTKGFCHVPVAEQLPAVKELGLYAPARRRLQLFEVIRDGDGAAMRRRRVH
jgi:hypothetical protein